MRTSKQDVIDLYHKHPHWTSSQYALRLGCGSGYVRATLAAAGLKLAGARTGEAAEKHRAYMRKYWLKKKAELHQLRREAGR